MTILVLAATARELAALAPHVYSEETAPAEMELVQTPSRIFRNCGTAFFCVTGVGPINAALAAGMSLARLAERGTRPDVVLNAGLAGSYDLNTMPLRTLCLVREEIQPEYGLNDGQSVTAQAFSWPMWKRNEGNKTVFDRISMDDAGCLSESLAAAGDRFTECSSLTVAGVSASFARAEALRDKYHADLENMEGFAVAYACARAAIPCVEIRSVSNKVGPRRQDEKDFSGALKTLGRVLPSLNLA
ncbi:MAG: futalosine hydrolase [Desulfovibrio sp.]|nr:futalosine hydrolase [Desulfovibrio sp.]